jgi:hypothetical protein
MISPLSARTQLAETVTFILTLRYAGIPGIVQDVRAPHFRPAVEFFGQRTGWNWLIHDGSIQPESCDSWSALVLHHPNGTSKKDVTTKNTTRAAQEKPN